MDINEKYFAGFEHRIIDTGEVKIHAWCGGSGHEAVLLLHGHPESHLTWYAVASRLAERYRVVIPDMRGYGESSKPHGLPDHSTYSKRAMIRYLSWKNWGIRNSILPDTTVAGVYVTV